VQRHTVLDAPRQVQLLAFGVDSAPASGIRKLNSKERRVSDHASKVREGFGSSVRFFPLRRLDGQHFGHHLEFSHGSARDESQLALVLLCYKLVHFLITII
jgi:hypothetical protein